MKISKFVLAGAAALALAACGKKEEAASGGDAAKTGAASPLNADFRLEGAEPVDVDALLALMPGDDRPTYDSAEFDERLGATVVANLRFADADDGESVLVERAEFYGVDLDAIERVTNAADAGPDAPFETLFQKVRLLNMSAEGFEDEEAAFSIGGVEFDRLAVRQGGFDGDGAGNEAARFFNAIDLGGLYFKDIAVETKAADAPAVVLAAPDLRFVGLGGGKLSAAIANDLEYQVSQTDQSIAAMSQAMGPQGAVLLSGPLKGLIAPDNQRVFIKSVEWRGVDLSGLLPWGLTGQTPPATERDLIDLGTIKAVGMESFIEGRKVMTAQEATVTAAEFTWLIPSKFRADTKGAVTDFTAYLPETETAALAILNEHGLDKVEGDGFAEWTWNPNSGVGDFDYVADTDGLADLSMAFGVGGLKLADIAAAQEEGSSEPLAGLAAFRNLSVTVTDETALDVLFALSALQMGGTAEDLRQSTPAMIRLSGASVAQTNPRVTDYVNAVADFVAQGGTLEVSAKPAEPVSLKLLRETGEIAPQTLPDVLNLTVTHAAPK